MKFDKDKTTMMYHSFYREHEDLKAEKKKYYDSWIFSILDIEHIEAQIKELQTSLKDQELDDTKKEVEHLKIMLEEENKRESTLTNQLKEKEKKSQINGTSRIKESRSPP